mmetsp:Transcript_20453/g.25281  ORF Transcript_20453/g.25281 Transcript_20453/m.25281 type:complete len:175 (-) Transcript_20453:86-610(-)
MISQIKTITTMLFIFQNINTAHSTEVDIATTSMDSNDDTDLQACSILKVFKSNTECRGEPDVEFSHPMAHSPQSGCQAWGNEFSYSKYCSIDGMHEKYYSRDNCKDDNNGSDSDDFIYNPNGCISDEKNGKSFYYDCAMDKCDAVKLRESRLIEQEYTEMARRRLRGSNSDVVI